MEDNIYVKLKDVMELLELIRDRDMYHDWSKSYEERHEKVKASTETLINSGVRMHE